MSLAALILGLALELPPGFGPAELAAAAAACSEALTDEACLVGEAEVDSSARVEQLGASRVLVVVRERDARGERQTARTLEFSPEDAAEERARAVGLTVGLLARSLREERAPAGSAVTPAVPGEAGPGESPAPGSPAENQGEPPDGTAGRSNGSARVEQRPADGRTAPPPSTDAGSVATAAPLLDVAAAGLLGWEAGASAAAAGAALELRSARARPLELSVGLALSATPAPPLDLLRITPSAGVWLLALRGSPALAFGLEAGAEALRAGLHDATSEAATGVRWTPAFAVRVRSSVALGQRWALFGALRLWWLPSATTVSVDGTPQLTTAAARPELLLGLTARAMP